MNSNELSLERFQMNLRAMLNGDPLLFGSGKGYRVKDITNLPLKVLEERDLSYDTLLKYFTLEPKNSSNINSRIKADGLADINKIGVLSDPEKTRRGTESWDDDYLLKSSRRARKEIPVKEYKDHNHGSYSNLAYDSGKSKEYGMSSLSMKTPDGSTRRKVIIVNTKKSDQARASRSNTAAAHSESYNIESMLSKIERPKPKFDTLKENIIKLKVDKKLLRDQLKAETKEKACLLERLKGIDLSQEKNLHTTPKQSFTDIEVSPRLHSTPTDQEDTSVKNTNLHVRSPATPVNDAPQVKHEDENIPSKVERDLPKSNDIHIYVHTQVVDDSAPKTASFEVIPERHETAVEPTKYRDCKCCSKKFMEEQRFSPDGFNDQTVAF